jgi:hypothetical protein
MLKRCKVSHLTKEEVCNVSEYYVDEMVGCILRMSADAIVTVVRVRNENIYFCGAKCRTGSRGRYHSHDWPIRCNRRVIRGSELTRQRDNIMSGSG